MTITDVVEHRLVAFVEPGGLRLGPGPLVGGGRLAVLLVVVPPSTFGLVAVHQIPQAPPLLAIEVLHPQRLLVAGPLGELVRMGQELVGADELDAQTLCQPSHLVAVGLGGHHRAARMRLAVSIDTRGEPRSLPVVDGEAGRFQLCGEVAHRRQDEVEPLPMERPVENRAALDHQDHVGFRVGVRECPDLTVELIAENPDGAIAHGASARVAATVARHAKTVTSPVRPRREAPPRSPVAVAPAQSSPQPTSCG